MLHSLRTFLLVLILSSLLFTLRPLKSLSEVSFFFFFSNQDKLKCLVDTVKHTLFKPNFKKKRTEVFCMSLFTISSVLVDKNRGIRLSALSCG